MIDWWAFRRDEMQTPAAPEPEAPAPRPALASEEVQQIISGVDGFKDLTVVDVAPSADKTCRFQQSSPYRSLFGCNPTVDQHTAVESFLALGNAHERDGKPDPCVDLVIQGHEGSGRTLLLSSMALAALLLSGRRSLVLCADDERADWMSALIRQRLESLDLTGFVGVGGMDEVKGHLRSPAAAPPPEICVTTLEAWEGTLSQSEWTHQNSFASTLSLLLSYEVLLVDDWSEHGEEVQAHLPVFADKRRLLLGSYDLPFQAVFCFPVLEKASLRMAFKRLLGDEGLLASPRHCVLLRYRPLPATPVMRVRATQLKGFMDSLSVKLAERDQTVTVFRKGIDQATANNQAAVLSGQVKSGQGSITIRNSFDGSGDLAVSAQIALCETSFNPWETVAVAIRCQAPESDKFWIITIEQFSDELKEASNGESLLFLDRFAGGVWEVHLRDVLRLLPKRRPARLELWARFGLLAWANNPLTGIEDKSVGGMSVVIGYEDVDDQHSYLGRFQKIAGVLENSTQSRHTSIDPWNLPGHGIALRQMPASDGIVRFGLIDEAHLADAGSPRILWQDHLLQPLGSTQLAHMRELVWRRGGKVLAALESKAQGQDLLITGETFRGDGTDNIHPRYHVTWTPVPPPGAKDETPLVIVKSGPDCQWLGCSGHEHGTVEVSLTGLSNGYGDESTCKPFTFRYAATAKMLLLRPTDAVLEDPAKFQEIAPQLWTRTWDVRSADFLPALTFALHAWQDEEFRGALFFGKALAFRLSAPFDQFARAVILFLEPETTGQTLSKHLIDYLSLDGNTDHFFRSLDHRLESGWDKTIDLRLARFWLPPKLRHEATLFERRLMWDRKQERRRGEVRRKTHRMKLTTKCGTCGVDLTSTYDWGGGVLHLLHCNRLNALAVSLRDGGADAPVHLLLPWTPPESISARTPADTILEVWKAVARHMRYRRDQELENAPEDCWLLPAEAWSLCAGDCEDHAILIVSILRQMGLPAWLTCGKAEGDGHAWVTFPLDGTDYLIEATSKHPTHLVPVVDARATYGWDYQPDWRCNGELFQIFKDGAWSDHKLEELKVEPLSESAA